MKPVEISIIVKLEVSLNGDKDTSGLEFTKQDISSSAIDSIEEKLGQVFNDADSFLNFTVKRVKVSK